MHRRIERAARWAALAALIVVLAAVGVAVARGRVTGDGMTGASVAVLAAAGALAGTAHCRPGRPPGGGAPGGSAPGGSAPGRGR